MRGAIAAVFILGFAATLLAQGGVQVVADGAAADRDNWYGAGAVQAYFTMGSVGWFASGSYVDATVTKKNTTAFDTSFFGFATRESISNTSAYRARRAALQLECDVPLQTLSVGVFALYLHEEGINQATAAYGFVPLPNVTGYDTTFQSRTTTNDNWGILGAHCSTPIGVHRIGVEGLVLADLRGQIASSYQAHVRFTSNPTRLASYEIVAGVVKDSVLRPFAQALMRWRLTPRFSLVPTLLYCGTSYYYDAIARYQMFYHELHATHATLAAVFDVKLNAKLFAVATFDHTDQFTMAGATVGVWWGW